MVDDFKHIGFIETDIETDPPNVKRAMRMELEQRVDAYLSNGGKITKCPPLQRSCFAKDIEQLRRELHKALRGLSGIPDVKSSIRRKQ